MGIQPYFYRMPSKKQVTIAITTVIMISTTGCMSNMQKTWDENSGKIIGGVAGAAIGAIACNGDPVCIAAGAIAGVGLGALWDKREKDLLALAEKENIKIETSKIETFNKSGQSGLEISINPDEMFKVGSAELTLQSKQQLQAVAGIYKNTPQKLLVIGHSDATGSSSVNLELSEQRAKTVAMLLAEQGIPEDTVFFQGAGESQPVSSNDNAEGRSKNRRVEIIEVDSIESIAAYSLQRKSDTRFISNTTKTQAEKREIKQKIEVVTHKVTSSELKQPILTTSEMTVVEEEIENEQKTNINTKAKVDFSGQPAQQDISAIVAATGDRVDDSFSFFSKAYASDMLAPCFLDSPRIVGNVQNLGSNELLDPEKVLNFSDIKQAEYWPGANGSVWMDTVNGNLVALKNLRILATSGSVIGQPEALIYTNYAKGNKTLDYKVPTHIETYKGADGLLVRSYFDNNAPLQCMDFVLANKSVTNTKSGVLYYETSGGIYENTINLHRINKGN